MKVVTNDGPKYTVVFNHPDDSSEVYTFFVDDENEPSIFASDEEVKEWYREMGRQVWNKYNPYGYYHTMTITSEWVLDGKAYTPTIFEEVSIYDLMD